MKLERKYSLTLSKWMRLALIAVTALCAISAAVKTQAQAVEKFYYWLAPVTDPQSPWARYRDRQESYVAEVSASVAATIDNYRSQGLPVGVDGIIAAGSADYNRNYFLPGHPVWNWHFAVVERAFFLGEGRPQCECPEFVANPSDIAADPNAWDGKRYEPTFYEVKGRIDPNKLDAVANVSNRGITGAGEKTLITGFIVNGGQPRNVVVRALGPSLSASGLQQVAANPKIDVYRGSTRIATNADWKTDTRASSLAQNYPSLAPSNDKEAALLLTLLPGAYTLQGINEPGTEGIMLLEVYDVDSSTVP
ncbi:MAG: hypothetical protein QOF24_3158 [Verrucomicrobiota bacterium]